MARPLCENCVSIDVRRWHREGRLHAGRQFSWSWEQGEASAGSIKVRVEQDAVILDYGTQNRDGSAWKPIKQRLPIVWTECHLGGRRPWLICEASSGGRACGRRAAVLYCADEVFACRKCYGLSYASQQETPLHRGIRKARKIRKRLGGDDDLLTRRFPLKPKGMHRQTYQRLREQAEAALACSYAISNKWSARFNRG
jgi:hypothetical protein